MLYHTPTQPHARKHTNVQFEWDDQKNQENIRKHKIDFSDVSEMFSTR
jgi:hypothetical protein